MLCYLVPVHNDGAKSGVVQRCVLYLNSKMQRVICVPAMFARKYVAKAVS